MRGREEELGAGRVHPGIEFGGRKTFLSIILDHNAKYQILCDVPVSVFVYVVCYLSVFEMIMMILEF